MNDTHENNTPGVEDTNILGVDNTNMANPTSTSNTVEVAPKGASKGANAQTEYERGSIQGRYEISQKYLPSMDVDGSESPVQIGDCYLVYYRDYIFKKLADNYRIKRESLVMLAQSVAVICYTLDAMSNIDYEHQYFANEEVEKWYVPAEFASLILPVKVVLPCTNARRAHDFRLRFTNADLARVAGLEHHPEREDWRQVFERAVDQFYMALGRQSWQKRPLSECIVAQVIDATTASALTNNDCLFEEVRPIPAAICAYPESYRFIQSRHAMWNLIDDVISSIRNNRG